MEQQSRYIAELRNEIYSLKGQSKTEAILSQQNMVKVEESCRKCVDQNYLKFETLLLNR
jgi:hypothetical protein